MAGEFQSNIQTAEQVATRMGQAIMELEQVASKALNPATRTSLHGNQKAQQSNQQLVHVVQQFQLAFQEDVAKIRLVAHEFAANDVAFKQNFDSRVLR
ncbi:TIGR04197 family type VII secretion effector [Listeria weihenstephanensis]|uniref:TIGR04197 family type VII secretion effector n=1 Tax=Listeria weihenstephanensis TaxID=1006155 RepID=A0A841ZA49_9LIST|nr:TIGR04197 family type VII secretion effector [Listeria weihenstephanensis]MBC1501346.1 TIGR04197 family type VII secretion effector [Listeria weihenstephanensis]